MSIMRVCAVVVGGYLRAIGVTGGDVSVRAIAEPKSAAVSATFSHAPSVRGLRAAIRRVARVSTIEATGSRSRVSAVR